MIKTPVVVKTEQGFDGRPIALLVQEASQYASKVYIQSDGKNINAKSIMGMMSLSLAEGEEITVVTDGEDEKKAAEGIRSFFARGAK
ncbi:MAG TPA: HPr family phosphocarrier protein [Candidatus Mediterraneibacter merdipullorum]|nr:HPr family phosphocarrier protein [Candidatus Mediterraneibacter merdipullorum]